MPSSLRDAHGAVVPSHFVSRQNVLIAFAFHCNLKCAFCMVEDSLGVKEGVSLETFRDFAKSPEATAEVRRIVLSGGEVTLDDSLLDYVAVARSIPTVRHVRLQTNGMRLASPSFIARLRSAGVDEFFVSLHGASEATCDGITRVPGSFRGIMNGIESVARSGGGLFTNTCITESNYRELPDIVSRVAPHRPEGMDFWGLWPRLDLADQRLLHARVGDVQPHLIEALRRAEAASIAPVVKWFPRCLLGEHGHYQNDAQPTVLIHNEYWNEAPEFACIYESVCAYGRDSPCAGLSEAYIHRHGWEERLLKPVLRPGERSERDESAPSAGPPRSPSSDDRRAPIRGTADGGEMSSEVETFLRALGLEAGQRFGAYTMRSAALAGDCVRLQLDDGSRSYVAIVRPRSAGGPSFGSSASLSLSYSRVAPGDEPGVVESIETILAQVRRRDAGGLVLPAGRSEAR